MTLQCRCDPPPSEYSHLVHPDMSSVPIDTSPNYLRRPFQIQETSRTLVLALKARTTSNPEETRHFTIFAPLQTFISTNLDPEAPQGEPRVIPGSEWMRSSHVLGDIPLLGHHVYGSRFVTISMDSPGQGSLLVCNFNPATIA